MKIIIDADACPVVDITVNVAKERGIECIIVCDNTHTIEKDGAKTIVVDKGADSADCCIANLTEKGDVIITQDYGLATLVLGKGAKAQPERTYLHRQQYRKSPFHPFYRQKGTYGRQQNKRSEKAHRPKRCRLFESVIGVLGSMFNLEIIKKTDPRR